MGAYNILKFNGICSSCNHEDTVFLQFKYGDTWSYEYKLGDCLKWGGNDISLKGLKKWVCKIICVNS
jgi:hypothetical protein